MDKKIIKLSKSSISNLEKEAVLGVLDREYFGMGKEVELFESALSNFFNRKSVAVVNGTSAIQLAIQACGIGENDEILVQSLTYIATFQAISANKSIPIPCDINPKTLTVDLRDAEKKITARTKAIIPVHYSGGVGDLENIYAFANKYNLRVIEDAAHAFGSIYQSKRVGSFGDIACFSFDGIKNITCGEGGCIVSSDQEVLNKILDLRLLGVEKDTEKRIEGKRSWKFDVKEQGWRYHMSNIMASIGIIQLQRFEELAYKRKKIAREYDELLSNFNYVFKLAHNYEEIVPHIYPIILDQSLDRDLIRARMETEGIETGIHYYPNHFLTLYRKKGDFPLEITESIYKRILTLPMHPDLTKNEITRVIKSLRSSIAKSQ